jgi:prepilin-type N-terminal cleavage/methylation domain-containing protein
MLFYNRKGLYNVGDGNNVRQQGFTLVELLAVVVILTLITAIVLAGGSRGKGGILLTNTAYEVAILLREAQTYGSSALKVGDPSPDASKQYGVFLDENVPSSVILFRDDVVENSLYDVGEGLETLSFTTGIYIEKFCWTPTVTEVCTNGVAPYDTLHITFRRPNPDAKILGGTCGGGCAYATIHLTSPTGGTTRKVQVWTTGQIAVID